MSDDRSPAAWHLWVVGVVALLWNALGCFDYAMTQAQGDAWLANMDPTELQMAYFRAMPAWTDAAWAIYVWSGALGAILLMLRYRSALYAFIASFLGWAAGAVYAVALSNGMEAMGPWWPVLMAKGGICAFFVWYAGVNSKQGVLR